MILTRDNSRCDGTRAGWREIGYHSRSFVLFFFRSAKCGACAFFLGPRSDRRPTPKKSLERELDIRVDQPTIALHHKKKALGCELIVRRTGPLNEQKKPPSSSSASRLWACFFFFETRHFTCKFLIHVTSAAGGQLGFLLGTVGRPFVYHVAGLPAHGLGLCRSHQSNGEEWKNTKKSYSIDPWQGLVLQPHPRRLSERGVAAYSRRACGGFLAQSIPYCRRKNKCRAQELGARQKRHRRDPAWLCSA